MRTKTIAATLAATAALIALPLPAAAAATKHYEQPASFATQIQGRGSNGYRFFLFTFEKGPQILSVSKGLSGNSNQIVNYFARSGGNSSAATDGTVEVKVGKLGHFRGHFVATSTKTRQPSRGCDGEPSTTEDGYFVGSFVFHGERGYTTIDTDRERGTVIRTGATRCAVPAEHGGREPDRPSKQESEAEEEEFRLVAGDAEAQVLLQVNREASPREMDSTPTTYQATVNRGWAGRFQVSRSASVFSMSPGGNPSAFQVPNLAEPLTEATVEPSAPFSGSATFHLETPTTASWTGDLAVELPGVGKVPLTGKKISAGLCQGRRHCTKTLPKSLQPLLEGGGFEVGISEVSRSRGSS